ncbi:hypothetical protein VNI00_006083 [Paramarasmius palmivorus]|uniref:Uncharacterized protein n=1 Tax=Paramarasmius palmivorus TaxID=297713 RepID=A0AAW0D902_9AGAR
MYPTPISTTTPFLAILVLVLILLICILFLRHQHLIQTQTLTQRLRQEKAALEDKLTTTQRQYTSLQTIAAASHAKYIQLERHFLAKEDSYERKCRELEDALALAHNKKHSHHHDLRPFMLFAERLLTMNRVWQQAKSLDTLRTSLSERKKAIHANAFEGFRDRLILSNMVWRQQAQLSHLSQLEAANTQLGAENTRLRQNLVRGITKAAKQMVLDTRREGLIEEFVVGLLGDLDSARREMKEVKERYEEEIVQVNGDWWRDYRRLMRQVEEMKLAIRARDVEREIGDELEERLVRRVRTLEEQETQKASETGTSKALVPRTRTVSQTKRVQIQGTRPVLPPWRF